MAFQCLFFFLMILCNFFRKVSSTLNRGSTVYVDPPTINILPHPGHLSLPAPPLSLCLRLSRSSHTHTHTHTQLSVLPNHSATIFLMMLQPQTLQRASPRSKDILLYKRKPKIIHILWANHPTQCPHSHFLLCLPNVLRGCLLFPIQDPVKRHLRH